VQRLWRPLVKLSVLSVALYFGWELLGRLGLWIAIGSLLITVLLHRTLGRREKYWPADDLDLLLKRPDLFVRAVDETENEKNVPCATDQRPQEEESEQGRPRLGFEHRVK
jgi:hypothetical protein